MKNTHAIFDLKPSKEWNILIDETGSQFKKDETVEKDQLGKFVALLLPKETSLPPLPINWHAVNHRDEIPEVISRINHSVCGIVGLSVDQMASLRGDLWDSCLRTLIDLILRL